MAEPVPAQEQPATGAGRRLASGDHFTRDEVRLALRNHGLPLEALALPITPVGLHYTLSHFDLPLIPPDEWRLTISGLVERPRTLDLASLLARSSVTQTVTLECAGNGRALMEPHAVSQPWLEEAVGTASWTGARLSDLLDEAGLRPGAAEVVFSGQDEGIQGGERQRFARSLPVELARQPDILVAYAMNGEPLLPQHGAPARLIVPGWYGMASIKWLCEISIIEHPFEGYQQLRSYRYTQDADDLGEPVRLIRVRSLLIPPGIPDFLTRARVMPRGAVVIRGRAWSGSGPIARVEFSPDDGTTWQEAEVGSPEGPHAWCGWQTEWQATPGSWTLRCRATDAAGNRQPLEGSWNLHGMGNNGVQRVDVVVE